MTGAASGAAVSSGMPQELQPEGRVSLIDEDLDEVFTLTAEVDGAPCRAVLAKEGVIRLVAPRPGELRLRVDNRTNLHTMIFEIERLDGVESAGHVNDWDVLQPGCGGWLERDASTGRAMLVEAARDAQGRAVAEADPRAAALPRTRFSVSVMPTYNPSIRDYSTSRQGNCKFWSPREWTPMAGAYPRDPADGKVWVYVMAVPDAERHQLPVRRSTTVADFKAAVRERWPAPEGSAAAQEHHLYLNKGGGGAELSNGRTLAECGVEHESHLILFPTPDRASTKPTELAVRVLFADTRQPSETTAERTVSLPRTATVRSLKLQLQEMHGVDVGEIDVRLPGTGLLFPPSDEFSLFYLVSESSRVRVVHASGPVSKGMTIYVKSMTSQTFEFVVQPSWTAADLKAMIWNTTGIPVDQPRLIFAGKLLQDDRTLMDYNIMKESTVFLVLRLAGGGGSLPDTVRSVSAAECGEDEGAAGPLVARVVSGEKRAAPRITSVELHVLEEEAAPTLTLEVSVDPSLVDMRPIV